MWGLVERYLWVICEKFAINGLNCYSFSEIYITGLPQKIGIESADGRFPLTEDI